MSKLRMGGVVAALSLILASFGGASASATAVPDSGSEVAVSHTQGMSLIGLDKDLADKSGVEVRYGTDGVGYIVSKDAPQGGDYSTMGYSHISGSCGSSYIQFDGIGASDARLATGFNTLLRTKTHYRHPEPAPAPAAA